MNTKAKLSFEEIFQSWRNEDQELELCIDEVRDWMHEVSQLGIPHFGETATRLRPLCTRLKTHFEHEDEMIRQLSGHYPSSSPEIDAVQRKSTHDHDQLLGCLGDLIERLDQTDPPFDSWQAAIDEVERFVNMLEQHEDQESECFQMLMPSEARKSD